MKTFLDVPLFDDNKSDVIIQSFSYDNKCTKRKGTCDGPESIRQSSSLITKEDDWLTGHNPLTQFNIVDTIETLKMASFTDDTHHSDMFNQTLKYLSLCDNLITLGGDHSITLPILEAFYEDNYQTPLSIIHFDAHLDTWNNDDGSYDHGTPFYHATKDGIIDPKHSIQLGMRSNMDAEHVRFARNAGFHIWGANDIHMMSRLDDLISTIKRVIGQGPVYLTFDIDCIDPSQAPGTGCPEPGGMFTWQALYIISQLHGLNFIGMDLVEVSPNYDVSNITSLTAAKIIWQYLSVIC